MRVISRTLSYLLAAAVLALTAALCIRAVGADGHKAIAGFARGAFGSFYGISEVLVRATPLILAALGVSIGFRAGFFNIGAEGQIYFGAAASTAFALAFPFLPTILMIPLALFAGFLAGGLWSLGPGLLKARFGLSETINTIMFNYIALNAVGILVRTTLKDPDYPLPISPEIPESLFLPTISESVRLHAGFFIALAGAAAVLLLMERTAAGFRMRAVGMNPRASRCAGISVRANVVLASALSGALPGLAGACEIAGVHHKLLEGISPGFGYLAIIVSLLGRNDARGIIASGIGIAALQVGSMSMQRSAGVPTSISWILMGLLVILVLLRPRTEEALAKLLGEAKR